MEQTPGTSAHRWITINTATFLFRIPELIGYPTSPFTSLERVFQAVVDELTMTLTEIQPDKHVDGFPMFTIRLSRCSSTYLNGADSGLDVTMG
jgi:hypothetical protein